MSPSIIPRAIVHWLRPNMISRKDTLSDALFKKSQQQTLSVKSVIKLLHIANEERVRKDLAQLGVREASSQVGGIPISSASFAIEVLRNEARASTLSDSVVSSLNQHLSRFCTEVTIEQDALTRVYWNNYNPDESPDAQTGISGHALDALGGAPDPGTQCVDITGESSVLQAFARMAGSGMAKLPDTALSALDAAFLRIYGVPSDVDGAGIASEIQPICHDGNNYFSLPHTSRVIAEIHELLGTVQSPTIKGQLMAKLDAFDARIDAAMLHFQKERREALREIPADARSIAVQRTAESWLGIGQLDSRLEAMLRDGQYDEANAEFARLYHIPTDIQDAANATPEFPDSFMTAGFRDLADAELGMELLWHALSDPETGEPEARVAEVVNDYQADIRAARDYWMSRSNSAWDDYLANGLSVGIWEELRVADQWLRMDRGEALQDALLTPDGHLTGVLQELLLDKHASFDEDEVWTRLYRAFIHTYGITFDIDAIRTPAPHDAALGHAFRSILKIELWVDQYWKEGDLKEAVSTWLDERIALIKGARPSLQ
ncbi:hypothetical protein [Stenotrophomonas oahuensis]|uniref:Uncharacterized protein n=1 Tax=Stenotrophomonas oahuensis TaxID=3003271 RepID=A0ABY9YJ63_9GAMM|nr:hypothetical protein [Stenotrophomonas sp. A5586]WNH50922.1 hypothetical protein PDM29_11020 [Stenotrophomonas sp. A5586]